MKNKNEATLNKTPTSGPTLAADKQEPEPVAAVDENKVRFDLLRRSVRVTMSLLGAVGGSRKLLDQFAAPLLEAAQENDSLKQINARKSRQRNAVFLAAKDVLDPDHPIKKSVEESLIASAELDPAIGFNAKEVKSKLLEQLDKLINQAVKEANEPKSAESLERFATTVQDLTRDIDLRSEEIAKLHERFKSELKEIRILRVRRLATTRNMAVTAVLMAAVIIGSLGFYIKAKRDEARALAPVVRGIVKDKNVKKEVMPVPVETTAVSSVPIPVSSPPAPIPEKIADPGPEPKPPRDTMIDDAKESGDVVISSGRDAEATKNSARAIGDAIRQWNEENDAAAAREKKRQK